MELRGYLLALRKHWWIILLTTVICTVASGVAYVFTPPVYSSTVTFYVSTPLSDGNNPLSAGQFAQARVNSYVALLESEELASRVIRNQRLSLTTTELRKEIDATAELNTVLVTAEVRDLDRSRSLAITRGIANTFGVMVDELDNQGRGANVVNISAVSGPTLAPDPVEPVKRIYGGLGVLAGLVLGAMIAIVREMLDMSVRNPQTATALLNAPVIGVIDYDPETKKNPLLIGDTALSVRAESFRQLRTNLQFIDATRSADVLLLTSSVPDEGKSLTSANLAISFVEFGDRVLLIEADLRRPSLWSYFGVERDVGLTNVLVGQMELSEAIQPWGNEGLFILPSGSLPPNPAELLGSRAMVDVIAELRPAFDKIIIDTPPLLPVTDAALCSAAADGVVLIIRAGKTHRSQVNSAVNALNQVNARMLGSILNMRHVSRSEKRRYAAEPYYDGAFIKSRKQQRVRVDSPTM